MSKVITFSHHFPSYHPRKGEPTYFVEKILKGLTEKEICSAYNINIQAYNDVAPKYHTIRAGHRFKAGDWFSPRVWSGKPYRSKQIVIAPDIQVKKVWDFDAEGTDFFLSGKHEYVHPEGFDFSEVEKNDGLLPGELFDWICLSTEFKKSNCFHGQVICWSDLIEY